jgi:phage gpG-like protein
MAFVFDFRLRWNYKGRTGGEALFQRAFMDFKEGIGDFGPAFRLIAEDILEPVVEQNFRQERGELTWQELAPSTVAQRGSEHPILRISGFLQKSFRKGEAAHREEITPRKLIWGSDVPYALFHQTGTGKGFGRDRIATGPGTGRGMPRRKELYLTGRMKRMMANTMIGRMGQIARVIGFKVLGSRGVSPLEARMVGEQILRGRGFGE